MDKFESSFFIFLHSFQSRFDSWYVELTWSVFIQSDWGDFRYAQTYASFYACCKGKTSIVNVVYDLANVNIKTRDYFVNITCERTLNKTYFEFASWDMHIHYVCPSSSDNVCRNSFLQNVNLNAFTFNILNDCFHIHHEESIARTWSTCNKNVHVVWSFPFWTNPFMSLPPQQSWWSRHCNFVAQRVFNWYHFF